MQIKLASWNIHRCIGRDGIQSPERCATVLQEIDADIIALQEVESRPGHELDTLAYLARETNSRAIAGTTMMLEDVHYGNAVLSRLPISEVSRHDLSVPGREPRSALEIDFEINGCKLQLLATHLGLRPFERREQVQRLLPLFNTEERDVVILAGDLNEWFLWGRPLRVLHRIFPDTPHLRSWPSHFPVFALDRIWVHPRQALHKLTVHRSSLSRLASDHLPLTAKLNLG